MYKRRNDAGMSGGFTIIEVLIVLAIAAAIMLIVFLAVPAAQRAQRNYARKQAVTRTFAQLETYKSNTKGMYPLDGTFAHTDDDERCDFIQKYMADPTMTTCSWHGSDDVECRWGNGSRFDVCYLTPSVPHDHTGELDEVNIVLSHSCSGAGDGDIIDDPGYEAPTPTGEPDTDPRLVAIWTKLEPHGVYCIDNGFRY